MAKAPRDNISTTKAPKEVYSGVWLAHTVLSVTTQDASTTNTVTAVMGAGSYNPAGRVRRNMRNAK